MVGDSYNLGIIDDDIEYVSLFRNFFSSHEKHENLVFSAYSLSEVLAEGYSFPEKIDLLFLDVVMPGIMGVDGIARLKNILPNTTIVMLSMLEDEETLLRSLCAGAEGYIHKSTNFEEISFFIKTIRNGGSAISPKMARHIVKYFGPKVRPEHSILTEKNLQVLHLLAEGWAYKTIADRIGISIDGVRYHIKEIYRALGVQSIAQAVRKYSDGDLPVK
jgi:DNA-binding NarL/FixJ family response regulator